MPPKLRRLLRAFAPFLLLLAGVALYNTVIYPSASNAATRPAPTTVPQATAAGTLFVATAVPLAAVDTGETPVATPVPARPPLPEGELASPVGPPPGSVLPLETAVIFYWTAAHTPGADERFAVYLLDASGETLAGRAAESNLGPVYQARFEPAAAGLSAGSYQWEVRLETAETAVPLWRSAPRAVEFRTFGAQTD